VSPFVFAIATLCYLAVGATIAGLVDRSEMKKHVPYAELPALVALSQMRALILLLMTFCGPFFAVLAGYRLVRLRLRLRRRIPKML